MLSRLQAYRPPLRSLPGYVSFFLLVFHLHFKVAKIIESPVQVFLVVLALVLQAVNLLAAHFWQAAD